MKEGGALDLAAPQVKFGLLVNANTMVVLTLPRICDTGSHNCDDGCPFSRGIAACHHRFIDDNLSVILLTNLLGAFP